MVNLRAYWRFIVVFTQFAPLLLAYWRDRRRFLLVGGTRAVTREMQTRRAERLLSTLLTLGPTFIKLGQLLSSRPDILPPAYLEVLSSLQDEVPPAPWPESKAVIEAELGPVDAAFDAFDTTPISGASLGQVYTAEVDGEAVAVKVRRPGIESLVNADLRVLRWSIPVIRRFLGQGRAFSLENLADEFAQTIRREMDYSREREILTEIRGNFGDDPMVRVPAPVPERSGGMVFTMEYLPGTKITDFEQLDAKGIDRSDLAARLQESYLQMIIADGVFHADPHPGNLAVADDGALIFYDFGMSGTVASTIQQQIVEFYVAVANQDIEQILDTLVAMGTLSPSADRQVMGDVMELAIADARGEEIEQYRVNEIINQVESTIYEFPLRLPRELALILRVATVVEGVCISLDEDFDFITVATDYLRREGYYEETVQQLLGEATDQLTATARAAFTVPTRLDRVLRGIERNQLPLTVQIDDDAALFERLGQQIVFGLLVAVGALSTAILYAFEPTSVVPAAVAAAVTLPVILLLYRSLRQPRGLRARPQFTRQSLREQREDD